MVEVEPKALYQRFLPSGGQHAYVWKYSQSIGGRRPRHFHPEHELNLVVSGSATFGVGSGVARVSAGELLAFPAGQDHVLLDATKDLYLYAIGLTPAYSAEVLRATGSAVVPLHVKLGSEELTAAADRAAAIVDRAGADQLGAELWERVHVAARGAAPRRRSTAHVLTRRALQRLETAPELGLDALADELATHPSEISRHFHRDLGMTLVRYRMRLRLLHFVRFVDAKKGDLTAAAGAAGFGSYSQCHRTFQSELGCAPREFLFSGLRERMELRYG